MDKQDSKTQEQNAQINKDITTGENDMTETIENVETRKLEKHLTETENTKTVEQETEVAEDIDIITEKHEPVAAQLPEGVTEVPRNEEEMHLKHIRKWPNAVQVYLKVSDDAGEVLGNKVLERQVMQFNSRYADPKVEVKNPEKVLKSAKKLAGRYTLQINMVESGLTGTITKYRIRQGQLFLIMKNLVKASEGPKWIEWFRDNFDGREFRSVQDYMRLAKVPGIIRYAVFGKERLLEILRQLGDDDWKERQKDSGEKEVDPVGAFIERNGIDFNPTEEVDAQELRIEADIAINHQKLRTGGIEEITKAKVEALVRNGKEVESYHIRELKAAKEVGNDVVEKFEEILASDGKLKPLMTPDRKATVFKKTADRFIKVMESAIEDAEYRGQVSTETIASLKDKIHQLECLFQQTA